MSKQHETDRTDQQLVPVAAVAQPGGVPVRRRSERGMVTIEYAVGAVMVIALVAAIILAINTGMMDQLTKDFAQFIFTQFKSALNLGG